MIAALHYGCFHSAAFSLFFCFVLPERNTKEVVSYAQIMSLVGGKVVPFHGEVIREEVVEEDVSVDLPEAFYLCDELPADPHSFLGYFSVSLIELATGETVCEDVKLEAPRYGSDQRPFTLQEITDIIQAEVASRGLVVSHILFYDEVLRCFQYLSPRKSVQCRSLIFRVLVSPPTEEKEEEKDDGPAIVTSTLSARLQNVLADKVSNPSFPDRNADQKPFVTIRQLNQKAAEHVIGMMDARAAMAGEEAAVRSEMKKEKAIYNATLKASRTDYLLKSEQKTKRLVEKMETDRKEKEARERQQQLLEEVRSFMASGMKCPETIREGSQEDDEERSVPAEAETA